MKILFITSGVEDYLADSILHGLRQIYGESCIDFPKTDIMYVDCPFDAKSHVRGFGFTLYSGLLNDVNINRFRIVERVQVDEFDLIVISDIWRQYGWFIQLRPWLVPQNTIILDGADTPLPYPSAGHWWRKLYYWGLPRAHRKFLYFKREWTRDTRFTPIVRLLPARVREWIPHARNLRKIAFSIPLEKITKALPEKTKEFPKHIVDPEVAERVPQSATTYAFSNEAEYYHDLQSARFGITIKRSGWDCLRHYEIAANGAVPCFRDLDKKPHTCAPHGLDQTNSITYHSADELFDRIENMTRKEYQALQKGAMDWVRQQTTILRAKQVIQEHQSFIREYE